MVHSRYDLSKNPIKMVIGKDRKVSTFDYNRASFSLSRERGVGVNSCPIKAVILRSWIIKYVWTYY